MSKNILKTICGFFLFASCLIVSGCGPDFYLSESEAAAYFAPFISEEGANRLIADGIVGQTLTINFDNSTSPPRVLNTNLQPLLHDQTTYGLMEGFNNQVHISRLNGELEKQIEKYIQGELKLYMGANNAGVQLSRLDSITVIILTKPAFTFVPERQALKFHFRVQLFINGTIKVDALDWFTNWLAGGINGTYPLSINMSALDLDGEAVMSTPFADAGDITLNINPTPGAISVYDGQSATVGAPSQVKDGVRDVLMHQLSRPLNQSFPQRYDYFALTGLRLTQGTEQSPSSLQYTYQNRPETARPMSHVVVRGADNKLYHMRKTEGGPNVIATVKPFPTLDTKIESEPALAASATDQLEVAAVTVNGELAYAHWRDEVWGSQMTIAPGASGGYKGKPAIVASAPGQVELISAARSGNLYHLRRLNGQWQAASIVPTSKGPAPGLRDPVAVQTGNKIVVIFIDGSNRPYAIAFDMESNVWGLPLLLSSQQTSYAPAAAASGNGFIEVVYAGMNGAPYHRRIQVQSAMFNPAATPAAGITLSGNEVLIGGGLTLNAAPELSCSGLQQLELVARRVDNKLYHTRFLGPSSPVGVIDGRTITQGWQPWIDLNGNFSGTLTFEEMAGFSAAVTRTGKLAVVSITKPSALDNNPAQPVFQNSYDVRRFGSQPWKTVLWRGYEQTGTKRFIGRPALAVTDRNSALAFVNSSRLPQGGMLAESNSISFSSFSSTALLNSPQIGPVVVSAMAGQLDLVTVGSDGRLRHIRRPDRGTPVTTLLSSPAGVTFPKQPAVIGYGNGFLEVVGVSQAGALYHWRYQNGTWSAPLLVSGYVISQPILVNFGGGQLMLTALGSDRRPYYWAFTGGAWSSFWRVPTNVVVNENYFNALSVSSWGDGTVDAAFVEYQTGALYHGRLGASILNSSGASIGDAFTWIGGTLVDVPLITALSPTRTNILAVGTDRRIYSTWSSRVNPSPLNPMGIIWNGFSSIGGTNLRMGGVIKLGSNELIAAGVDPTGKLMLSRNNGAGWMQFQSVTGPNVNLSTVSTLYRPQAISLGN